MHVPANSPLLHAATSGEPDQAPASSAPPPLTPEQLAIEDALAGLRGGHRIAENIVRWEKTPPVAPRYAPFPPGLAPEIVDVLRAQGFEQLYTHQAEATRRSLAGEHICVVTPTASGKTLCYNLPVLQRIFDRPESRALYLFPTKALAHDQYAGLYELTKALGREIKVYTFDGDTPVAARRTIRSAGQLVVSNPDMLHAGILPHHTKWLRLFENLDTVVIDELHQYRGVFGSHVANVIRRLRRICAFYGSHPRFICCSATVANPGQMAETLIGEPVTVIDDNGAPRGERVVVFYNPPVVNKELGIRASSVKEARRVALRFIERDLQTIVFAKSRIRVEILTTYLQRALKRMGKNPDVVRAYRAGYLPRERRAIEQGIKSGAIKGVVSTNALELGIDIGSLQAAVLCGWPGTIASAWQQGGRAGRKQQTSVVVLVASSAPLDQFLMQHPEFFLGASPEQGILNPDNMAILAGHLKCAINEIPMREGEVFGAGPQPALLEFLEGQHVIRRSGDAWHWSSDSYPAEEVSLRTATAQNFIVHNMSDGGRVLAEVDYDSAQELIHPQAVYLHQTKTFFVDEMDWEGRKAYVREVKADYYTDAVTKSDLFVLHVDESEAVGGGGDRGPGSGDRGPGETGGLGLGSGGSAESRVPGTGDRVPGENGVSGDSADQMGQASMPQGADSVIDASAPTRSPDPGTRNPIPTPDPILTRNPVPGTRSPIPSAPFQPLLSRNFGDVRVDITVPKFKKVKFETQESIGMGEITLPQYELHTQGAWWTLHAETKEWLEAQRLDLGSGLKGIAWLFSNVAALFVMSDPRDLPALAMVRSSFDGLPAIYVYDRVAGGVGLARRAYAMDRQIFRAALERVGGCDCEEGCPSCVGPSLELGERARASAAMLLRAMLGGLR